MRHVVSLGIFKISSYIVGNATRTRAHHISRGHSKSSVDHICSRLVMCRMVCTLAPWIKHSRSSLSFPSSLPLFIYRSPPSDGAYFFLFPVLKKICAICYLCQKPLEIKIVTGVVMRNILDEGKLFIHMRIRKKIEGSFPVESFIDEAVQ